MTKSLFEFVKAVISGSETKCQSKAFLSSIIFRANCSAVESLAKSLLMPANDLVKATKQTLTEDHTIATRLEDTGENKLYKRLVDRVSAKLQSMEPHLHAQHLSHLIMDTEHTGVVEHIDSFKPSEEWDQNDRALLERAIQMSGIHGDHVREYINMLTIAI